MGSGASIHIPDEIDRERFKELAGDRFSQEIFDESK